MKSNRRSAPVCAPPGRSAGPPTASERLLRNLHLLRVLVEATLEEGGLPSGHGITVVQMKLLRLLAARGGAPTTLGVVARKLQVSVPAASKAIARLVASGHVVARDDRADARRLHIDVTAAGEDAIRRYEAARARRAEAILERAGAAGGARWIESLEGLVSALVEVGRRDDLPCLQCGLQSPPTCAAEQGGSRCPVRAVEERVRRRRKPAEERP
jgi:DNA-binding MarR family transcriptional regulator